MSLKLLANQIKQEQKNKEKSVGELFVETLDKYIVESRTLIQQEKEKTQRLAFRPSSYYKCPRMVALFLSGANKDFKLYPRSQRILEVGTALHEWVQTKVLLAMSNENSPIKIVPAEELPVYGNKQIEFIKEHNAPDTEIKFVDYRHTIKYPISAMVDGVLDFNGIYYIFEFKTINPDEFTKLIEPVKDHVKQGAIYSLCLGINNVIFLYLCKGTQNWKAFDYTYNENQLNWVKQRLLEIEQAVLNNNLPPKKECEYCKWCEYKKACGWG